MAPAAVRRFPRTLFLASLLATLAFGPAPRALALATEHVGNAPVPPGWGFAPDLLSLLNARERLYWREVNGDANFYYQGDTATINAALRRFAAKGQRRDVVLLPGPREVVSFDRKHRFLADWELHVPGGISLSNRKDGGLVTDTGPAVYLYVSRGRPTAPASARQVARWIEELDSPRFKVRERAGKELEKQGQAAEAALRKALAGKPSAQKRRAVEALLGRLSGINLDVLEIPGGLRVLGPDDLLARYRKGLKSQDAVIRGVAASLLAEREPDPKVAVAGALKVLKEDRNEYVRRCVAGALGRLGKQAGAALPALREGLRDPDRNVREAFRSAIAAIEADKGASASAERRKLEGAVREEIRRFLKSLPDGLRK